MGNKSQAKKIQWYFIKEIMTANAIDILLYIIIFRLQKPIAQIVAVFNRDKNG